MGKPKPTLGLAMICQNEAIHIAPSIAQFFTEVDDIVVVDGGSRDDSVMWAERMGARVFHRPLETTVFPKETILIVRINICLNAVNKVSPGDSKTIKTLITSTYNTSRFQKLLASIYIN